MSQSSYLREFCAQVSQIVFLADLTVLRLITTVWVKFNKTHIREFWAQVSQIVFLADMTVLYGLLQLYEWNCHKTHISRSFVHK